MSDTNKPQAGDTLVEAALKVLLEPDPWRKAEYTYAIHAMWNHGQITFVAPSKPLQAPDRPSRDDSKVQLMTPGKAPKRGKGGTLASRQALLHSLVHIENWAIDLSWDIIARFGCDTSYQLPREFFSDFVQVAEDECRHFSLLCRRLEELGSHYGALPAHDGLWESATATAGSLPARLAVEHCCHEARGLDVLPSTIHKFRNNGDEETAALLENVIYPEEVSHCAAGVRWLKYLHQLVHTQQQQQQQGEHLQDKQRQQQLEGCTQQQQQQGNNCQQEQQRQHLASPADAASSAATTTTAAAAATTAALQTLQIQQPVEPCAASTTTTSSSNTPGHDCCSNHHQGNGHGCGCSSSSKHCSDDHSNDTTSNTNATSPSTGSSSSGVDWQEAARAAATVQQWFHVLVRSHFYGALKPPFNTEARAKAGFDESWYLPLAHVKQDTA